jgi:formylglycine-generating enzyme required for sulfatase activity
MQSGAALDLDLPELGLVGTDVVMRQGAPRDSFDPLDDFVEDILSASDEQLLAEAAEDFGSPMALAAEFDQIVLLAQPGRIAGLADETLNAPGHDVRLWQPFSRCAQFLQRSLSLGADVFAANRAYVLTSLAFACMALVAIVVVTSESQIRVADSISPSPQAVTSTSQQSDTGPPRGAAGDTNRDRMRLVEQPPVQSQMNIRLDAAGDALATARDLGIIGFGSQTIREHVGGTDKRDVFKFTTQERMLLTLTASDARSEIHLDLLNQSEQVIQSSHKRGIASQGIERVVDAETTYYVSVTPAGDRTPYALTINLAEIPFSRPEIAAQATIAPAHAGKRVALVIGNSSYQHVERLPNPVNDATAMAALFRSAGFDAVELRSDLRNTEMRRAIGDFAEIARNSDIAVIYYAGHGIEVNGVNYLVPTDAVLARDFDVEDEAIALDRMLKAIEPVRRLRLMILDACRNNPFVASMKRSSRAIGRGFSPVEPMPDTLIAYAAKAGTIASDGFENHSPFTAALLKHIGTPGLDVRLALGAVRDTVMASTTPRQEPFVYGSLGGRAIAIVEGAGGGPAASATAQAESPRKQQQAVAALGVVPQVPVIQERTLRAGDSFKECEDCPDMVVVPAGTFVMGSPLGEPGREQYEGPQQKIFVARMFAVGRTEVSFTEWDACLADGGCNARHPSDNGWGRGSQPAIYVSWEDTRSYVEWLSRKTGAHYRLLSEAEWEYAARGCRFESCPSAPFWFGANISRDRANYDSRYSYEGSAEVQPPRRTLATDSGAPNPFGLLHVHGNVREWVEDCWNPSLSGQPRDGSARMTGDCRQHILRGGSWADEPKDVRSAKRMRQEAGSAGRRAEIGFRVARDLPNARPE